MAIVWFVKEGDVQVSFPIARKPLQWCIDNIGLRPDNWRSDLTSGNLTVSERDATANYQQFGYVVVEVDQEDLATSSMSNQWRQGFHLLDSNEIEAGKI